MGRGLALVPVLVFLILIASAVVCVEPAKAQYQGDIIINADGSATPSTAPIQRAGNIYTSQVAA